MLRFQLDAQIILDKPKPKGSTQSIAQRFLDLTCILIYDALARLNSVIISS